MAQAREGGRTTAHLGHPENAEGFRGGPSPHPALADYFRSLLAGTNEPAFQR